MRALDTNVLARFVLNDDPAQTARAENAMAGPFFVSDTVLLELAWLLSSRYAIGRPELAAILGDLLAIANLTVERPDLVTWAVERFAAGADFADMLHIAAAGPADSFVTFEAGLAHQAGPLAPIAIEQPPA
jgi:predicted nucleic-acid-binding protein